MKSEKRPGGFTLIELLISIAVIVVLMSIVFRLANVGGDTASRDATIKRLEALENCLSAYYAAFGCYPPVPLQGVSRNIFVAVDELGMQKGTFGEKSNADDENGFWMQVDAAARAQPVRMYYPTPQDLDSVIANLSAEASRLGGGSRNLNFTSVNQINILGGSVNNNDSRYDGDPIFKSPLWTDVQLFRYGLLAYLLPRYRFMMGGKPEFYEKSAQWKAFNSVPTRPDSGKQYSDWHEFLAELFNSSDMSLAKNKDWIVDNLPSQTVCRRWLPNLKGLVSGGIPDGSSVLYGVNIELNGKTELDALGESGSNNAAYEAVKRALFSCGGRQYVLNSVTVVDGWGNDFYYYSPPPHQTYWLWSAGPDGKTCPPWIRTDSGDLTAQQRKWLVQWGADDIVGLSN